MRIVAVHGSNGMAARWPRHVEALNLEYRAVDGTSTSILDDLRDCDAFLWHLDQGKANDLRFARSVLLAAASMGLRVYPDHNTSWHFDDKVAQKYALESIGAPLADTWVYFDRDEALEFASRASYPLVFKLRRGAGSLNVLMVRDRGEAVRLVTMMFGRGVSPFPATGAYKDARNRVRRRHRNPLWVIQNAPRVIAGYLRRTRSHDRERDYVLFQRFVPGNDHDVRVVIVGRRAFAWRRGVRPHDFRASGYGSNTFLEPEAIDTRVVELGFRIARDLRCQSLALDFVFEPGSGAPVVLEVSFATIPELVDACRGYFDDALVWHPGSFDMAQMVLQDLVDADAIGDRGRRPLT